MTILTTIILGIIEGLTEFLPVSSTGHLILASNILGLEQNNFLKSFEIIIQVGAILAVIVIYFQDLLKLENLKKLIVGFIPTGLIGFLFFKEVKKYLFGSTTVILSLIIGGLIIIIFEIWYKRKQDVLDNVGSSIDSKSNFDQKISLDSITYKQSAIIGFFQSIAIIPGVSRSAATIIGGLALGLPRNLIVKFSFLIAVPTIIVASAYDTYKNLAVFSLDNIYLLVIGFLISFIVAFFAIKFFIKFISKYDFIAFGVYRIILAVVVWIILF